MWFKKITRQAWYWRTNALFIRSVLLDASRDNLLLIPIYRPNVLDNPMVSDHPSIWRYYLRDLVKDFPDGRGHMNQAGHNHFLPRLAAEVWNRWEITLTRTGNQQ